MKILFIGDIMGRAGRDALEAHLPGLRKKLAPDVIIINGENAAHGKGITPQICKDLYALGADCITTGNHVWDQREIIPYIDKDKRLLRPINYPEATPGQGAYEHKLDDGRSIVIINAMGRLFMETLDDPFAVVHKLLEKDKIDVSRKTIFVDFHAETTSEKMSFAHYFDGRVSAVVGTHTHIPTADAHILPGGTAYMTDAGMSGDYDSVIGVRKDIGVHKFVKKMPGEKLVPASGPGMLCGAFIVTDDTSGLAQSIEPVRVGTGLTEQVPQ
ncbi:MAG TPA: TIGR00282 family metallophosphoesterase [Rhodospirillaceae bacterium]|nr:TIGR00282 family metallophosphoesterase [Rhodospirillaceae bacterium]